MDQLGLFEESPATDASGLVARSRKTDPETSRIAAAKVEANGSATNDRAAIAKAVRQWPGATAGELAAYLQWIKGDDVDNVRVSRRIAEISTIEYRDARKCNVKHSQMKTIWPK